MATIASKASQDRAARPGAAVDDELVGPLGDLGVEVVHQHPHRRLLLPAAAGDLGSHAARAPPVGRSLELSDRTLDGGQESPEATSPSAAASSGASHRSGPVPGTPAARTAASAAPVPAPGSSGARRSRPRAAAHQLDREDAPRGWRSTCAASGPLPSPSTRDPPASRSSAASRRSPGAARRRFSATIAACVYWASISPELTPGVLGQERPAGPASAPGRGGGRFAARRSPRPRRTRSPGSRTPKATGAPWKFPHDSTRPSGRIIGLSIAEASSASATRASVSQRVAGGAVHLRRAAQRVGVLHARIVVAVAGDDRRALQQAVQVGGARRLAGLRAAARSGPRRRRGRCPSSASTDIAAVTSATPQEPPQVVDRQHQHAEDAVGAVDQRQALLRRSASAARCPAAASASAAASRSSVARRTPRPRRSGPARSGPAERGRRWPRASRARGTTGVSPAFSMARIASATSGRAPE